MSTGADTAQAAASTLGQTADGLSGFAVLGKTALALALVVALIFLCSWLLRRLGPLRQAGSQPLRVVGSSLLGPRERLVVVEVRGTWLVLGVTPTQISKLHELPAPDEAQDSPAPAAAGGFGERFARALRHQLSGQGPRTP